MSRVILNDHRWTAGEIEYQEARGRYSEVAENQEQFPPGSEAVDTDEDSDDGGVVLELSQEIYEFVQSLDVPQLKNELKKVGIKPTGDEVQLKVKLAQHLQEQEDKENADDA